jgi:glycosyltransferase involved in cell wall biosynthesis
MSKVLSILVPVFNEEKTIITLIEKVNQLVLRNGWSKEFIIVDDASWDRTPELVKSFLGKTSNAISYVKHDINQGKGKAIKTGLEKCSGDYTVILDADLEYDPAEINLLLAPVDGGYADVVYGSRFVGGRPHRILFFWHSIGNKFLTFVSNMFTNLNLTDMEVGYKLFKTSLLKGIDLQEKSFGFEPEVTAKISRIKGVRIYEVGISYYGRTYAEGKKIDWRDGLRALYCIIKYNIFSR